MKYDYFYGQQGDQFSFYRIPKALFQDERFDPLCTDAKLLYGLLLDRMSLSSKSGWMDESGRVYIIFTIEQIMEALRCSDRTATKLLKQLETAGLIERKRQGLGKPNLIFVKNFASVPIQNRNFFASGSEESTIQDPKILRCTNTDSSKTEDSDTDPILPDEEDGMGTRTRCEDYFLQSLEADVLVQQHPDDEDLIYQIIDLLVDTCSTRRKMVRIAGDDKPAEVVRARLKKLTADHISYVLKCLSENTAEVRNLKQYLLTSLYNAPTTMSLYYQNQTNHDLQKAR